MVTTEAQEKQLLEQMIEVSVKDLTFYRKNPRIGNIEAVADSLKKNGQFKPIVVQKSTMEVLAGNHTLKAALSLKWKKIYAVLVDVDDEAAKRIVLADNRTSDLATYDSEVLAQILDSIEFPQIGTGYDSDDVKSILAAVEDRNEELMSQTLYKPPTITFNNDEPDEDLDIESRIDRVKERSHSISGDEELTVETELAKLQSVSPEDQAMAELQSRLEDIQNEGYRQWQRTNYWGIPDLRRDMLVDSIPENLDTWAGQDVTPDDGKTTWIYNYGVTSPTGIPWDRTMLSFFTYDTKFDVWLQNPAYYAAKMATKGVTQSIVPDTSFWVDDPRINHLKAVEESMFTARIMQEAGIKIIPRLMWCDLESIKYGLLGIPQKPPVVAVCIQAISDKEMEAQQTDLGLREYVKILKPEALILYSGNPGKRMLEKANLPKDLHVVMIDNFAAKRRGVAYDKKDGKAAVDAASPKKKRAPKKIVVEQEDIDDAAELEFEEV